MELARCLASLPEAADGLDAEVVVVDNDSGDTSVEVARSFPHVTVIAAPSNTGYARAMNRALAGGDADVLVAVNPDDRAACTNDHPPRPRAARRAPGRTRLAPRLTNGDGSVQHSVHRFPSVRLALVMGFLPHRLRRGQLGRRWWLEGFADLDHEADVDWVVGAVHVVRREALAGRTPYRERSFMYAEDMDLCWRLRRDGWRVVFVPKSPSCT